MPQPDARIEIYRFGAFELAAQTGELIVPSRVLFFGEIRASHRAPSIII